MDPAHAARSERVVAVVARARAALENAEEAVALAEVRQRDAAERQRHLAADTARRRVHRLATDLSTRALGAEPAMQALLTGHERIRAVIGPSEDLDPAVADDLAEEKALHDAARRWRTPAPVPSPAALATFRRLFGEPFRG